MKKNQIGCSIAGILSSLFFLLSCSKATDNVIDLRPLYRRVEPSRFNQNWEGVGNFMEMTDGTVLFFHPSARQKLRSVLCKEISEHSDTFQIFSSLSKKSEIRDMVAREHGGSLVIGHLTAKSTELDRLLIAPEWPKIYSYLESLCPGPTKLQSGITASSIVRLNGSRFLITGGAYVSPSLETADTRAFKKKATIFDAASGDAVKTFPLCQSYRLHMSLLLPDGRVLLLGDYNGGLIEIVDPKAGTSRLLSCQFSKSKSCFTACLDREGNCILIGGFDTPAGQPTRTVEKIDLTNEVITRLPDLDSPRCFVNGAPLYYVDQNAIVLPDDSILISGGLEKYQTPMGIRQNLDAELYRTTNDATITKPAEK